MFLCRDVLWVRLKVKSTQPRIPVGTILQSGWSRRASGSNNATHTREDTQEVSRTQETFHWNIPEYVQFIVCVCVGNKPLSIWNTVQFTDIQNYNLRVDTAVASIVCLLLLKIFIREVFIECPSTISDLNTKLRERGGVPSALMTNKFCTVQCYTCLLYTSRCV